MKTVFLLMVASALLVVSGLAQTPDAGSNRPSHDHRLPGWI
jgi:hypothetical protein